MSSPRSSSPANRHTRTRRPQPGRSTAATARPAAQPARGPAGRSSAGQALDAALTAAVSRPAPAQRTFAELGLPAPIVAALTASGIESPFAIQARALPDALAGRDVLGRAQTGSGKTLAFGLPLLSRLHAGGRPSAARAPRGLVLVPTRELAQQVADAIAPAAQAVSQRVTVIVGGTSIGRQIDELRRGVDVVVATPGRLLDLLERRDVRLDAVEIVALDEADHMADLGFLPAVTKILDATPQGRQCLLFSATLDGGVDKLVSRFLDDPAVHAVAPAAAPVESMEHRVFVVGHDDKVDIAAQIGARPARTLFFVRTKHGADRLAKQLTRAGTEAVAIHGNLNQNQRLRALDAFSTGRVRVLVATDVAARGLHVDDLDLVVHFDPPVDHKAYLHRSGRTARAGAEGTVLSLVESQQSRDVATMHRAAGVRPDITTVSTRHPAVASLARSGDVITVLASAHPLPSATDNAGARRPSSRSGRGAGARTSEHRGEHRGEPSRRGGAAGGQRAAGSRRPTVHTSESSRRAG